MCARSAFVRKKKRRRYLEQWEWRESRTARRHDELHFGERIAATLRWQGIGSTLAHADCPEGHWTFERPRILSRDVEIRDGKTDELVAMLYPKWTGSATLELADGRCFAWEPTDFWQMQWAFFDSAEQALVSFTDTSKLLEARTAVTVYRSSLSEQERGLLTMLGRYLLILRRHDAAAVVAATSSVAAT
jgi:hypothetical protein